MGNQLLGCYVGAQEASILLDCGVLEQLKKERATRALLCFKPALLSN
jgi:hypothetical protein